MKIYNVSDYLIILLYLLACMYFAPDHLGPWTGMLIGAVYFVFCWFLAGLYLADVLHMGIAHRALDYDLTGVFCTSGSEREFTLEGSWYADEEIQAGADRDTAAAG